MSGSLRIQYLFEKYLKKQCSPAEIRELTALLQDDGSKEILSPQMRALWEEIKEDQKKYDVDWPALYEKITGKSERPNSPKHPFYKPFIFRMAAAVAFFAILSGGWYFLDHKTDPGQDAGSPPAQAEKPDIHPGGNKAILTLANGVKINLDEATGGVLASQGNTKIIKSGSGKLAYQADTTVSAKVEYNVLTTPIGGQYQLRLQDGTKVWLNAASSIRFPATFTGKERQVELSGEAYFDIAPDAKHPFVVKVNNMQVKVLGTKFNINAYPEENIIKTTLEEGRIKVENKNKEIMVTPGQQVRLNKDGKMNLMPHADLEEAFAWKNGLFVFHEDALSDVMRKLSRWYDVQVEYTNNQLSENHFTGAIRRQVNLSEVLKMLELTGGAHFKIEGRKIIVM